VKKSIPTAWEVVCQWGFVAAALEDTAAITKALKGATSLFAMTAPSGGTDAETRHGIAAAADPIDALRSV